MSRLKISNLPMVGLKIVERQRLGDARGFLSRLFCSEELSAAGWHKPVAQINHTFTKKRGTVRGMHFQKSPYSEMKLVSCIRGEIWDVAIDLRKGSKTFLAWHAELLSADNQRAMLIPEGFAHGFQTLTDDVELLYCHSETYVAEAEAGLNAKDHRIAISWPLEVTELSERDMQHPMLTEFFMGLTF